MKKKIFSLAMVAFVIVLSIAGASIAYFTDVEDATNVFTAGNVDIALTYGGQETNDGTLLDAGRTSTYPGQVIEIDAAIENIGSEGAYVGAIISLTKTGGFSAIITPDGTGDTVKISELLDGLVISGSTVKYVATANGYDVYVLKTEKIINGKRADIFSDVKIPTAWNNTEMAVFNGVTLDVKAYATQTVGEGFQDASSAITTAFATDWAAFATATALN